MAVARSRILDLMKAQCRIFSTTFNPEGKRTGNKILRQRLKGPAVAAYYPPRTATFKDLVNAYPDLETWDDDEEDRLDKIENAQARGKGAPKKKRTAEESKKFGKKRPPPATAPARG
ncbi:MAG: mitochondral 37S ribosomal protein S27 [Thelocarpon impressellum]|nr:MAG: mitochondral 37S ribosomal protein S27 [Thelocarpon impressellum]